MWSACSHNNWMFSAMLCHVDMRLQWHKMKINCPKQSKFNLYISLFFSNCLFLVSMLNYRFLVFYSTTFFLVREYKYEIPSCIFAECIVHTTNFFGVKCRTSTKVYRLRETYCSLLEILTNRYSNIEKYPLVNTIVAQVQRAYKKYTERRLHWIWPTEIYCRSEQYGHTSCILPIKNDTIMVIDR